MSELRQRVLVSVIFIPLLLAALWLGGAYLVAMFALVNILGGLEYITMMRSRGHRIAWIWLGLGALLYGALLLVRGYDMVLVWTAFLFIVIDGISVWDEATSVPRVFAICFGLVYTAVLPAMITRIGLDYIGQPILLSLIAMIWIVDSAAYFVGMSFGRHRGVTAVSPRKSLEGFLAGAFVPVLIVVIIYYSGWRPLPAWLMLLIAIAAGIFGQLGDLAESMLKRYCGVKDSSRLIPGHGGILDRTDSILLAGSFLYCVIKIFEKVR